MGAWGFKLFQSDQDFEVIGDLSNEAGLEKLLEKGDKTEGNDKTTGGKKTKGGKKAATGHEDDEKDAAAHEDVFLSLYQPSDPELVRKHLDSGILLKMLEKYGAKLLAGDAEAGWFWALFDPGPGYVLLLLGACAMSLGCKIPEPWKKVMQRVYMCVGLPSGAIDQMKAALDGYKDGEPWSFNSPDLVETANLSPEPEDDGRPFALMNVWGPGTLFYKPPMGSKAGLMELRAGFAKAKSGEDICGGCGAKHGKGGGKLLACAGCKSRKYCSKECQRRQWTAHKEDCEAMAAANSGA